MKHYILHNDKKVKLTNEIIEKEKLIKVTCSCGLKLKTNKETKTHFSKYKTIYATLGVITSSVIPTTLQIIHIVNSAENVAKGIEGGQRGMKKRADIEKTKDMSKRGGDPEAQPYNKGGE